MFEAEKVESAYESLRQKTTDVYVQRARQLFTVAPQRTCLLLWTLDDVTVVAMADPSYHGYDHVVRVMREIDHTRCVANAKAYNTCIAPQAAYRSCSGAVHVTDRAGVQLNLRPQTDLRPTSHTQPWSAF